MISWWPYKGEDDYQATHRVAVHVDE